MPQLQWLGDIEKETSGGYLAKALGGGVTTGIGTYLQTKEKKKTEAIAGEELALKKKQLDLDYTKVDYDKRKDAYDSMIKLLPMLPEDKQAEMISSEEWKSLEKSLGVPSLTAGTTLTEKKEPTWGQAQDLDTVRADILRGVGVIKEQITGEFVDKPLTTRNEAISYASSRGYSPVLVQKELDRKFGSTTSAPTVGKGKGNVVESRKAPNGHILDKYSDGRIIDRTTGQEVR